MTNQEYVNLLVKGTSDLLIENGQNMYQALAQQNYEYAATLRDQANEIINVAAVAFEKSTSNGNVELFKEHFSAQTQFILDSLIEEYGQII